jgi:GxxExxY protein
MMHAEHADNSKLNELSGRVIGCAFTVLNTLGAGLLEEVYENTLAYVLRAAGLSAAQGALQRHLDRRVFRGPADQRLLLVELKTVKALDDAHMPPGA